MKHQTAFHRRRSLLLPILLFLALTAAALLINRWNVTVRLVGDSAVTLPVGAAYAEAGAEAFFGGRYYLRAARPLAVSVTGDVDTGRPGVCTVTYRADCLGLHGEARRTVTVVDDEPPTITLTADPGHTTLPGAAYEEEGYAAYDRVDGDLTAAVERTEEDGAVVYRVRDRAGNTAEARRVIVYDDPLPPTITLLGGRTITVPIGVPVREPGYIAVDNVDGDLTSAVVRTVEDGRVVYTVTDHWGNRAEAVRTLRYNDPLAPAITLLGGETWVISAGTPYKEPGYTALDNADGDLTSAVAVRGTVDPFTAGTYTISYSVEDREHNLAEVLRTVVVTPLRQPDDPAPDGRIIYLTFDDGPSRHTERLLGILEAYNVKATFFVVDYGYAEMIGREAQEGHSVGVHSATHAYRQIYQSEEAYFADLNKMNEIIFAQTGRYATMIRFPGGSSNMVSRFNPGIMTRLTAAVTARGYRYFDWNVASGDAGETTEADVVYRNVIDGVRGRDVSVVLMHDSKEYTVDAVERILIWGIANGYTFLPLTPDSPGAHHRISN